MLRLVVESLNHSNVIYRSQHEVAIFDTVSHKFVLIVTTSPTTCSSIGSPGCSRMSL